MKFLSAVLGCVLGAGVLFMAAPGVARADARMSPATCSAPADAGAPPAMQPGTDAEAREYGRREAASPEVQEFEGGEAVVIGGGFILLVLVIVLIVLLVD